MKKHIIIYDESLGVVFLIFIIAFGLYLSFILNQSKVALEEIKEPVLQDKIEEVKEKELIINEVSIYPDEAIELYNNTDNNLKLKGYYLKDKSNKEYHFTKEIIKSHGYLVIKSEQLGFNINNSNESISLMYEDEEIDLLKVNKLKENISVGRNDDKRVYYDQITLGQKNSDTFYQGFSEEVTFSINGGYVKKNTKVSLNIKNKGEIYYTLDGSFPTKKSLKYQEPIEIKKNTVIKAICYQEGLLPSDIISRTFLTERQHDLAFISISTNNLNFYTVYNNSKEQKMNLEFYENDGSFGVSFIGDIKVSGRSSSLLPQKSMSVYLRKKYGMKDVTYPFFKDLAYNTFSSFVLRNGGTDQTRLHIKDALLTSIIKDEMDIDMQEYRPVVVYLNGNYYGIYSLREKLNVDYLESKYKLDKNKVDLFKKHQVDVGNSNSYNELMKYIKSHNIQEEASYNYLKSIVDIEELINYWIVECFYNNSDFFKNNVRYYKHLDGKWRFMLFDLDYALEDYETKPTLFLNRKPRYNNIFDLIVTLYQNKEFQELYYKKINQYLSSTFKPERMNKIIDEKAKELEHEIPYHIKRWRGYDYAYGWDYFGSLTSWKYNINSFKKKLEKRYYEVVYSLKKGFNMSNNDYQKYFGGLK